MPDEVQKTFVRSFVDYLKQQVESNALAPDAAESVEVAIQCLQAAFDIGMDEEESQNEQAQVANEASSSGGDIIEAKQIDLFEMFQSLYIERNPKSLEMAETIKNEGNRLMKDGKYNEALLQYNRAITFDPNNPIFYCNRAAAYIRLGDNARAVTDCKSALVYNPNYGKAYGRLGIAYSNLAKYEEAKQAYEKAIELEPDNQDYRNNLEVARNARTHIPPMNAMPQLPEEFNALRNIFNNRAFDIEQIQTMAQHPIVMNAVEQLFSGMQRGGGGGVGGGVGAAGQAGPIDIMQIFNSLATQMANTNNPNNGAGNNGGAGSGGGQSGGQQPPPAS